LGELKLNSSKELNHSRQMQYVLISTKLIICYIFIQLNSCLTKETQVHVLETTVAIIIFSTN